MWAAGSACATLLLQKLLSNMGDPAIKAIRDLFDEWEATRLIPAIEAAVSKAVEQATAERDAKIAALESQLSKTQEELRSTVIRLDQLESYSRRNCINISGVPEAAGERTDELVLDVARAAGVNMAPRRQTLIVPTGSAGLGTSLATSSRGS